MNYSEINMKPSYSACEQHKSCFQRFFFRLMSSRKCTTRVCFKCWYWRHEGEARHWWKIWRFTFLCVFWVGRSSKELESRARSTRTHFTLKFAEPKREMNEVDCSCIREKLVVSVWTVLREQILLLVGDCSWKDESICLTTSRKKPQNDVRKARGFKKFSL